ncbi:MAG: haloacid dehalogenase-like hydrolase [Candidatus Amulumruptor caecigallinarius]|nr:haloacid dehalogenase-like hydrolase [Candidatus Amulumruptor caecigallinarius]
MALDKKRLVLFDFDGTLTVKDSFTAFIRHACGVRGLFRTLLLSAPAILAWKLGRISNSDAKKVMFRAAFKNYPANRFREMGVSFAEKVRKMERKDIVCRMRGALEAGDEVAIVSASLEDWIRPWAESYGVRHVVATKADAEGTRLSGELSTPNCHGEEKVRRLIEEFPDLKQHRDRLDITAYGDSSGDNEMWALSNWPVRVNHGGLRDFIQKWI